MQNNTNQRQKLRKHENSTREQKGKTTQNQKLNKKTRK